MARERVINKTIRCTGPSKSKLNQMYTTEGLGFQNISGQDVRTRQNLFAHEQLFLYEYARYLLHKQLVTEGLLSPYSNRYYPPTDTTRSTTEENDNNESNTRINKEAIAKRLQKNIDDIILKEDSQNRDTKEWKEVKKNRAATTNEQKSTKEYKGYYDELQDKENEEEEVESEMKEDRRDETTRPTHEVKKYGKKKDYNVDNMRIEEMDKVIAATKKDLAAEYEEENEQLKLKTVQLEVYIESMTVEYQKTKEEVRTLKSKIQEINQVSKDNSDLTNELAMQDETKIEELENQMDILRKENSQVNELVQELGEVIKQSDNTINEYKKDNEDLRQKLWKAIRRIQSKDNDLEGKKSELESAYEVIEELEDRLRDLGEEFDESDEDD